MKIIFMKDNWIKRDIFDVIYLGAVKDYEEQMYERHGVKPNKDTLKLINSLTKSLDYESKSLKMFAIDEIQEVFVENIAKDLYEVESIEELPRLILNLDQKVLITKVLDRFSRENGGEDGSEFSKGERELTSDQVLEVMDSLSIKAETKWLVFQCFRNTESFLKGISEVVENMIPKYMKGIGKHIKKMEKFNQILQDKLDREGEEIYKDVIQDIVGFYDRDVVYMETSFIQSKSMIIYNRGQENFVRVGFEIEESLGTIRGKNEQESILNVTRTISDPLKFKILSCMKDGEVYGKEICDATGQSKAALSYHMGQLINMGLVKLNNVGNKVYYSLKRDMIIDSIEKLKNYF